MSIHHAFRSGTARVCGCAIAALAILVTGRQLLAQEAATSTDPYPAVQEMEPLAWLIGDWKGEGWTQRGPEGRIEFIQTEHVERAFGGRILLVEGIGRTRVPEGEGPIGFHAFGVLSWNPETDTNGFDTYLANGAGVDAEATVEDGVVTWGFDTPQGKVRYRIRETEAGQWHETGDFSPDGGTTWLPFFEMTLDRVEPSPGTTGAAPINGASAGSDR